MIARVRLLLPSYVGMLVDDYTAVQFADPSVSDYEVTVHPPMRVRREIPDGFHRHDMQGKDILMGWQLLKPNEVLTGNTVVGKDHWWANCLIIDFKGDSFPQDETAPGVVTVAVTIANDLLRRLRWRGSQYYIKEIPTAQADGAVEAETEFHVEYLDDDHEPLPKGSGYRGFGAFSFRIQSGAITPENWQQAWKDLAENVDVPLWEQLLLDVAASELDGRAVITAFTALEGFIRSHVEDTAAAAKKDDSFWKWLMNRDDNYDRQPAISEVLDQVLYYVDGRSLKTDAPELWSKYQELKRARNKLVHDGQYRDLTKQRVGELVATAREVIDWVRQADAPEEIEAPQVRIRISDTPRNPESLEPQQGGAASTDDESE